MHQVREARRPPYERVRLRWLPMFVVGREYPEATDHMIQGLGHHAPWVRLTYKYAEQTNPPWYWAHAETEPGGAASCKGTGMVKACDEFPWLKTEQGGPDVPKRPHLKIIDWLQNSASGGLYGTFVTPCKLPARKADPDPRFGQGDFLVVPLPAELDPEPSANLCNGPNPAT
jgi:hypothetical protein